MYCLRVEDFIDVKENKSSFELNDMVHICKRKNNTKRQYLFVNKYQAKHYPVSPKIALKLFDELYEEITKKITNTERILVVGFAETATGIAQRITHKSILEEGKWKSLNIVYHLQTTREDIDTNKETIKFDEEHSHAVTQKLFYGSDVPIYDRVLFIEDEITTGNTILNFIEQFRKLNPGAKYAVASILNWQNEENSKRYEKERIDTIYLVKGNIKENLPEIELEENEVLIKTDCSNDKKVLGSCNNPRVGMTRSDFKEYIEFHFDRLQSAFAAWWGDRVMVIGTEENMYLPILIANWLGDNATVRSTTRSPITVSKEDGYLIYNGIQIPSAYDTERTTYLYNIDSTYEKALVVLERATLGFKECIRDGLKELGVEKTVFEKQ